MCVTLFYAVRYTFCITFLSLLSKIKKHILPQNLSALLNLNTKLLSCKLKKNI